MGGAAQRARLAELKPQLQFDDAINIQFTSGTTGAPKGATLTHHNILNNGFFIGEAMRLTERDRVCIPVPLYHCFGMVLGNLACVTHGAAMVYPGEGFEPQAVLETVAAERCTALYGVPTMFIAELDHPDFARHDLSSLRTGIMAGSPCPIEIMRRSDQRHAHARRDDLLRHDRDEPGQHPDRASTIRSSAGSARSAAFIPTSRSRSSTPRAASCRPARRANCARAAIR